ncbi:cyanuric acid amidohydrolase, partial [Streptococcus suis]|nr:cyanuric acid amidohydrolase [Streptococcus suis]
GLPPQEELDRIVNVLAKAEASSTGTVRGRRNTMQDDSDINHTRSARAVVNAAIAAITRDPLVYVSGGAEHQGPDGGGPISVIAKV